MLREVPKITCRLRIFFTNNVPGDDRCICNLHEQFASAADLQELFALTVDKKKYIALLY